MLILHEVQVHYTSANPLLNTGSQEYSITSLIFSQEKKGKKERKKKDRHDRIRRYTATLSLSFFFLKKKLTCEVYRELKREGFFVAANPYFSLEFVYLFIFLFIFRFEFGEWKSDCIVERVIFVCKLDCLDNADG